MPALNFLSAEWRYLVMLNYEVAPAILQPLVPLGTELDFHGGRTFVSLVGFRFLRTRVLGVPFPLHTDFDEVNLRFYVRRRAGDEWRRGVVFIREMVPRPLIAWVARACYGEPYTAVPMRHRIEVEDGKIRAEYAWRRGSVWETLHASGAGEPQEMGRGSLEEFIAEHYWGYTARRGGCSEFQVRHARWRIWPASDCGFEADAAALYGERFAETLAGGPASAFIAEGSPVTVRCKRAFRLVRE